MELLEYSLLEGALVVTWPKPSTPNKSAARQTGTTGPSLSLQSVRPSPGNQGLWSYPALWSSQSRCPSSLSRFLFLTLLCSYNVFGV